MKTMNQTESNRGGTPRLGQPDREVDGPWVAAGALTGAVIGFVALSSTVPAIAAAFTGTEPKGYWYLSRALGLVSFVLLSLSMTAGLALSTRSLKTWPGAPYLLALHRSSSAVGLGAAAAHALVLLGDRFAGFDAVSLLLPFASPTRSWAVGLGQLAVVMMATLVASFHLRSMLGPRTWRALHYLAFATFAMALVHGLSAGTDRGPGAFAVYAVPGSVVLFATLVRLGLATASRKADVSERASGPRARG